MKTYIRQRDSLTRRATVLAAIVAVACLATNHASASADEAADAASGKKPNVLFLAIRMDLNFSNLNCRHFLIILGP